MLKTLPSTFIYSGAAPQDGKAYPHHHPKFKIDEKYVKVAKKLWVQCVRLLKFKIKVLISI